MPGLSIIIVERDRDRALRIVDGLRASGDHVVTVIAEETGLVISGDDLIGPVATRHVLHGYSDVVTAQDEVFWLVRTDAFEVDAGGVVLVKTLPAAPPRDQLAELRHTLITDRPGDLQGVVLGRPG